MGKKRHGEFDPMPEPVRATRVGRHDHVRRFGCRPRVRLGAIGHDVQPGQVLAIHEFTEPGAVGGSPEQVQRRERVKRMPTVSGTAK